MTPRDLWNIHSTGIAEGTHFHAQHSTKTTLVYLPDDGETSWLLLSSLVSLLSGSTVQPENTYSCFLKVTGQVWESCKRISINTNHNYHQHSSPWASLNWSNDNTRFSFKQPNAFMKLMTWKKPVEAVTQALTKRVTKIICLIMNKSDFWSIAFKNIALLKVNKKNIWTSC